MLERPSIVLDRQSNVDRLVACFVIASWYDLVYPETLAILRRFYTRVYSSSSHPVAANAWVSGDVLVCGGQGEVCCASRADSSTRSGPVSGRVEASSTA